MFDIDCYNKNRADLYIAHVVRNSWTLYGTHLKYYLTNLECHWKLKLIA